MDKRRRSVSASGIVAAALTYDELDGRAPSVSALGSGDVAKQLVAIAKRYGVPIEQSPQLAGELQNLALSQEIPAHLFDEVASVFVNAGQQLQTRAKLDPVNSPGRRNSRP